MVTKNTASQARTRWSKGSAKKWLMGVMTACMVPAMASALHMPATSGSPAVAVAEAATIQHVHTVRNTWLRRSERIAKNGIRLERARTNLTVLPGGNAKWWHVRDPQGRTGYVVRKTYWVQAGTSSSPTSSSRARVSTNSTHASQLPPGVRYDSRVKVRALRTASTQTKINAVLAEARSKLGTPYRWGHNEDRGQYGFDCSNFTAYVYHHALGYKMSGASLVQAHSIGWTVPRSSMRPGDLLIFENGKHVGIYVGNNKMIQEGGGLGKVGYLSIGPGSYWGKHLTAVKRMFH